MVDILVGSFNKILPSLSVRSIVFPEPLPTDGEYIECRCKNMNGDDDRIKISIQPPNTLRYLYGKCDEFNGKFDIDVNFNARLEILGNNKKVILNYTDLDKEIPIFKSTEEIDNSEKVVIEEYNVEVNKCNGKDTIPTLYLCNKEGKIFFKSTRPNEFIFIDTRSSDNPEHIENCKTIKLVYNEDLPRGYEIEGNMTIGEARLLIKNSIFDYIKRDRVPHKLEESSDQSLMYGACTPFLRDIYILLTNPEITDEGLPLTNENLPNNSVFLLKKDCFWDNITLDFLQSLSEKFVDGEKDFFLLPCSLKNSPHSVLLVVPKDLRKKIILCDSSFMALNDTFVSNPQETFIRSEELGVLADKCLILNIKLQNTGICNFHCVAFSNVANRYNSYDDLFNSFCVQIGRVGYVINYDAISCAEMVEFSKIFPLEEFFIDDMWYSKQRLSDEYRFGAFPELTYKSFIGMDLENKANIMETLCFSEKANSEYLRAWYHSFMVFSESFEELKTRLESVIGRSIMEQQNEPLSDDNFVIVVRQNRSLAKVAVDMEGHAKKIDEFIVHEGNELNRREDISEVRRLEFRRMAQMEYELDL